MKIKTKNIKFESFNDGICSIYYQEENNDREEKYSNLRFCNRTLGFKRHFAAKSINVNIVKVIRIPLISNIDNHDTVNIVNDGIYQIELIQVIDDTNPSCIDLTLKKI